MPVSGDSHSRPVILIVGASRGLGHAMAAEFLEKDWTVIGTVRGRARTALHDLAEEHPGRVEIEMLDITEPEQIAALRQRLSGRVLDILFVNAGATNADPTQTIGEVSTREFVDLMITNALSPMRVVEVLQDLVPITGLIGVMSSGQGSVANNVSGKRELYRGTKAALNQFMRSFAARESDKPRAMAVIARLGAHRPRRTGGTPLHRGEHPEPGECVAGEAGQAGTGVPRLPRPNRALVKAPVTRLRMPLLGCAAAANEGG